jgi:hypothetical protein
MCCCSFCATTFHELPLFLRCYSSRVFVLLTLSLFPHCSYRTIAFTLLFLHGSSHTTTLVSLFRHCFFNATILAPFLSCCSSCITPLVLQLVHCSSRVTASTLFLARYNSHIVCHTLALLSCSCNFFFTLQHLSHSYSFRIVFRYLLA